MLWLRPCKRHDDFSGIKYYCVTCWSCENECMYSWHVKFNYEIIYYRHLTYYIDPKWLPKMVIFLLVQSNLTWTWFEVAANEKSRNFSGRARDTGKLKKTRQFLTPKENERNALPNLRRRLTTSSCVIMADGCWWMQLALSCSLYCAKRVFVNYVDCPDAQISF